MNEDVNALGVEKIGSNSLASQGHVHMSNVRPIFTHELGVFWGTNFSLPRAS